MYGTAYFWNYSKLCSCINGLTVQARRGELEEMSAHNSPGAIWDEIVKAGREIAAPLFSKCCNKFRVTIFFEVMAVWNNGVCTLLRVRLSYGLNLHKSGIITTLAASSFPRTMGNQESSPTWKLPSRVLWRSRFVLSSPANQAGPLRTDSIREILFNFLSQFDFPTQRLIWLC